jgi:hypothetical protein
MCGYMAVGDVSDHLKAYVPPKQPWLLPRIQLNLVYSYVVTFV